MFEYDKRKGKIANVRSLMEVLSAHKGLLAFCEENPGPQSIALKKASDAELWCFLWSSTE